ncbi:MAG TPA: biopolymer transporter ExbD [Candidatus Acidoferrales bacterium]|nr:biopolymer transporter ExbD [Candidatus Acidoferrales bacterium]
MGMMTGGRGMRAEINVTPMIDVLLVLIIISLVIQPSAEKGLHALIPQQQTDRAAMSAPAHDIVVEIAKDNVIHINTELIDPAALSQRLLALRVIAPGAHFFVRGDRDLSYKEVAQVIDIARGAGWDHVGLMTR